MYLLLKYNPGNLSKIGEKNELLSDLQIAIESQIIIGR